MDFKEFSINQFDKKYLAIAITIAIIILFKFLKQLSRKVKATISSILGVIAVVGYMGGNIHSEKILIFIVIFTIVALIIFPGFRGIISKIKRVLRYVKF